MLVLGRFVGETVHVGEGRSEVVVVVAEARIQRGRIIVKLGFVGDRSIPIVRGELLEARDE